MTLLEQIKLLDEKLTQQEKKQKEEKESIKLNGVTAWSTKEFRKAATTK